MNVFIVNIQNSNDKYHVSTFKDGINVCDDDNGNIILLEDVAETLAMMSFKNLDKTSAITIIKRPQYDNYGNILGYIPEEIGYDEFIALFKFRISTIEELMGI